VSRAGRLAAAPVGLDRATLTGRGLFFFSVSASAPMTVLAGGIVAAYSGTGIVGVPAAFVLLMAALGLFSVGYVSMARYVPHAGPLYAHVAQGLGPVRGVGAAVVALLSYNAVQCCLYGLLGATMARMLGGAASVLRRPAQATPPKAHTPRGESRHPGSAGTSCPPNQAQATLTRHISIPLRPSNANQHHKAEP
jgi:hypothetical protein